MINYQHINGGLSLNAQIAEENMHLLRSENPKDYSSLLHIIYTDDQGLNTGRLVPYTYHDTLLSLEAFRDDRARIYKHNNGQTSTHARLWAVCILSDLGHRIERELQDYGVPVANIPQDSQFVITTQRPGVVRLTDEAFLYTKQAGSRFNMTSIYQKQLLTYYQKLVTLVVNYKRASEDEIAQAGEALFGPKRDLPVGWVRTSNVQKRIRNKSEKPLKYKFFKYSIDDCILQYFPVIGRTLTYLTDSSQFRLFKALTVVNKFMMAGNQVYNELKDFCMNTLSPSQLIQLNNRKKRTKFIESNHQQDNYAFQEPFDDDYIQGITDLFDNATEYNDYGLDGEGHNCGDFYIESIYRGYNMDNTVLPQQFTRISFKEINKNDCLIRILALEKTFNISVTI